MERDQTDIETENNPNEILPENALDEKQKKVRKPRSHKSLPKDTTVVATSDIEVIQEISHDLETTPSTSEKVSTPIEEPADEQVIDNSEPKLVEIQQNDKIESSLSDEATSVIEEDTSNESEIPPITQIRNLLTDFEMRVPVWGLTVFTVDGYILAHRLFYDGMPENLEMVVSSMSAGLITISQDFIRLVKSSSMFRQVLVDADDESGNVSFSVLLKHIAENVMLTCIFPGSIKLGLVTFEIENLSQDINEIVSMWDVKLHEETVT